MAAKFWTRNFWNDTYECNITLCVGPVKELREWAHRTYPSGDFSELRWRNSCGKVIQHEHDSGVIEWFIWMPEWTEDRGAGREEYREHVISLQHECGHLAMQVLREHGVELVRESEEAFTYLGEAFFRAFWKELDKWVAREKLKRSKKSARRSARKSRRGKRKGSR